MQFTQLIRNRRLIFKGSNYKTTLQLVGSFGNEARSSEAKYLITLSAGIFTLFYKKKYLRRVDEKKEADLCVRELLLIPDSLRLCMCPAALQSRL